MKQLRLLLILLLCHYSQVLSSTEDPYRPGVEMFDRGDYLQALEFFLASRSAGGYDPALEHNIAVCYFRLERWPEANATFARLHEADPLDSLVSYNLAVTEKKLGRETRAAELFLEVSLTSPSDELALLANRQYERLERVGASARDSQGAWLASASLNLGNDSNVVDPTDEATTERDDNFAETLLSAAWYSSQDLDRAWTVDLLAYNSRYQDVDDYDIDLVSASVRKYFPLAGGHWSIALEGERSRLGGDDYLGTLGAVFAAGRRVPDGYTWNIKYRLQDHSSLDDEFDAQEGYSHRLEADLGARMGDYGRWRLRYRYDFDDRDDFRDDARFISYSAQRHGLQARWVKTVSQWEGSLGAGYRFSKFEDENIARGEPIDRREDNRYRISARLSWFLNQHFSLSADYSFTDNDSNIDRYDYDRHLVMGGINWQL